MMNFPRSHHSNLCAEFSKNLLFAPDVYFKILNSNLSKNSKHFMIACDITQQLQINIIYVFYVITRNLKYSRSSLFKKFIININASNNKASLN